MESIQTSTISFPTWKLFQPCINITQADVDVFGNRPLAFTLSQYPDGVFQGVNSTCPQYVPVGKLTGIDIPVLLNSSSGNGKLLVVLGESPLRSRKNAIPGHDVVLCTPYAVHQGLGSPQSCDVYKMILTDCFGRDIRFTLQT